MFLISTETCRGILLSLYCLTPYCGIIGEDGQFLCQTRSANRLAHSSEHVKVSISARIRVNVIMSDFGRPLCDRIFAFDPHVPTSIASRRRKTCRRCTRTGSTPAPSPPSRLSSLVSRPISIAMSDRHGIRARCASVAVLRGCDARSLGSHPS